MQSKLFYKVPKNPKGNTVSIYNTSQEGVVVSGSHFIAINDILLWQAEDSLVFLALFKNNISTVVLSLLGDEKIDQHLEAFEKHSGSVCTRNFLTVKLWNAEVNQFIKPAETILQAAGMKIGWSDIHFFELPL